MRQTTVRIAAGAGVVLALTLLGTVPAASAAASTGSISGKVFTVEGDHNTLLSGMKVQAKSSKAKVYTTRSRPDGTFTFGALRAGTYSIKVTDDKGHVTCDGGCSNTQYYKTEWLGGATSFSAAEKIRLSAGEKHTGVRVAIGAGSTLDGKVVVNGHNATKSDGAAINIFENGKLGDYGSVVRPRFGFSEIPAGNYRLQVSSTTGSFPTFWAVDETDGNTTFHLNGVNAIRNIRIEVTTP